MLTGATRALASRLTSDTAHESTPFQPLAWPARRSGGIHELAGRPHGKRGRAMTDVLVLTAHPHLEHSRVNRALMQAAAAVDRVEVRDLYALYPDYLIDVAAEQDALLKAQL